MASHFILNVHNVVYPDSLITLALFRDVVNIKELRRCVMGGEIEVALIKTSMVRSGNLIVIRCYRGREITLDVGSAMA